MTVLQYAESDATDQENRVRVIPENVSRARLSDGGKLKRPLKNDSVDMYLKTKS